MLIMPYKEQDNISKMSTVILQMPTQKASPIQEVIEGLVIHVRSANDHLQSTWQTAGIRLQYVALAALLSLMIQSQTIYSYIILEPISVTYI